MKVMIVSDTHRRHKYLEQALNQMRPIDHLIHLGDVEGCDDYIEAIAECPVDFVSGNNDFFSDLPQEKIITLGKYKILLTHGHYYYVNSGIRELARVGREKGVDIVMYGHTHRPSIEYDKELVILNPGSISYPRQDGRQPTYIMMEIDLEGTAHFTIHKFSLFSH